VVTVLPKPEGVADGDDRFADHHVRGVAHGGLGQVPCIFQMQDGQVEVRVGTDQFPVKLPPVKQAHPNGGRALDDVGIGQHQILSAVDNHPGPETALLETPRQIPGAEKMTEQGVVEHGAERT
jgi:hypothetical protein